MECYQTASIDDVIHAGAGAPYALRFDVTNDDPAISLLDVTSARFEVQRESGQRETWTAAIDPTGWSETFVRLLRELEATDVPRIETIRISPVLVTAAGEFRAEPRILRVVSPFDPALSA